MTSNAAPVRNRAALVALTLFAACLLMPLAAGAGGSKLKHYDVGELAELLRSEGYGAVQPDDNRIVFKADGSKYVLFLYDDGDLQLYYGLTGISIDTSDINSWNRSKRLSRAYLDNDSDPVLEADLLANAGINDRIITEFVKVFVGSASRFRSFLHEHDQAVPAKPSSGNPARGI